MKILRTASFIVLLSLAASLLVGFQHSETIMARRHTAASGAAWTTSTITCAHQTGSGTATSASCTPSSNIASGLYIFVAFAIGQSGCTLSVTDSNSDTFTSIGAQVTLGGNPTQLFWGKAGATITSVTGNISGCTETGTYPGIMASPATDSGATPALDGSQCSGGAVATTFSCSSALTLAANDYVYCGSDTSGSGFTFTAGSGFTLAAGFSTGSDSEYGLFTTSVTPSISVNSGTNGGILCAAFKP
jgi:hypothetical protein